MKKFKFRLEQVLKHRHAVKTEKKRLLMVKNLKLRQAEGRLADLEAAQGRNSIEEGVELPVERVLLTGMFSDQVKEQIDQARLVILDVQKEVEEALAEYIEAAKEANALDTLKNKRQREYYDHVAKEEEKVLDEVAVQRAGRQGSASQE